MQLFDDNINEAVKSAETHPPLGDRGYAEVIIPLALPKNYTWSIPERLQDQVHVGVRVEVELRKKISTFWSPVPASAASPRSPCAGRREPHAPHRPW